MRKGPRTKTVRGPKDYLLIHPEHPARHPAFDGLDRSPGNISVVRILPHTLTIVCREATTSHQIRQIYL